MYSLLPPRRRRPRRVKLRALITARHHALQKRSPIRPVAQGFAAGGALRTGDATVHDGWTMHSAGENASGIAREAFTISVFTEVTARPNSLFAFALLE